MKILYILLTAFLITCTKEYSGEGTPVVVDTIPKAVDTIPNPVDSIPYIDTSIYFVYFDTLMLNNNKISHISIQVLNNRHPNFWGFALFTKVEGQEVWRYSDNVDVTWLMEYMPPGDTAFFRMAVVYRVNGIPNYREEFSPIIDTVIKK